MTGETVVRCCCWCGRPGRWYINPNPGPDELVFGHNLPMAWCAEDKPPWFIPYEEEDDG